MFGNYLKSTLRFLERNKIFTGINILGLSLALGVSFVIVLYVVNELSYDHCHAKRARIFKVINHYKDFEQTIEGTPYVLASTLKEEFPQIEISVNTRLSRVGFKIKCKDEYINVQAVGTSSDIFIVFTLPMKWGQADTNILSGRNSIVLSSGLAEKLFPEVNPVGKNLSVKVLGKDEVFTVKAVFYDIPENSSFQAECFINDKWEIDYINKNFRSDNALENWTYDFWTTWVLLKDKADALQIENKFEDFEKKYIYSDPHNIYKLQNLSDVYLKSEGIANVPIFGSLKNIRLFSVIVILLILVAVFNYIILSTVLSSKRAKEIGIRKTNGAGNQLIRKQILGESVIVTFLSLPLAVFIVWLALPVAGRLFGEELHIIKANIINYAVIYVFLTLLIGLVSGGYAAGYLSGLKVIDVLQRKYSFKKHKFSFRSVLIVVQLVIFCSFVSGALIIRSQYYFSINKETGYFTKNVLLINVDRDWDGYDPFLNQIRSNAKVINAGGALESLPVTGGMVSMYPSFKDENKKVEVEGLAVDYGYLETMGIKLLKGRFFSKEYGSDLNNSVILNEAAVKRLGIEDPLGKEIEGKKIIGIVKDFNVHSLHSEIPPLCIDMTDKYLRQIAVHYREGNKEQVLSQIESYWKQLKPDKSFDFTTVESLTMALYSSDIKLGKIVSYAALFTSLIAILGLFGLSLFEATNYTKEIGIKKTLGCSVKGILWSLIQRNVIIVIMSCALSVPISLYLMNRWLESFAYKLHPGSGSFILSGIMALFIAIVAVSWQSWQAATRNPVEALRNE